MRPYVISNIIDENIWYIIAKETFELAQHKIQVLMEKDSYPRFIESELYQQLLESAPSLRW
jgi:hypothetical protein